MNQVYTIESCRKNGNEIIRISDEYWNEHSSEFLKDKESFDKQMIEFLKNVENIHSKHGIELKTPVLSRGNRYILHTFTRRNIIYFITERTWRDAIWENYPMIIQIYKIPDIPKKVIESVKPRMTEENKIVLENLKKNMFQQFETMWNTTIEEYFELQI